MVSFDFSKYLLSVDPIAFYAVDRLSGGLMNETVRATKLLRPSLQAGCLPGYDSLILKHASPFIAALGDSFPFPKLARYELLLS